jgi:hypothetical protein
MDATPNDPPRDVIWFAEMEAAAPIQIAVPRKTAILMVQGFTQSIHRAGDLVPCLKISHDGISGGGAGYPMQLTPGYANSEVCMISIDDGVRPMDIVYLRRGWLEEMPRLLALLQTDMPDRPYIHIGFIGGMLSYGATHTPDLSAIIEGHYSARAQQN